MLVGRLAGASLGAKISSKAMLTFTSALGLILVDVYKRQFLFHLIPLLTPH